MRICSHLLKKFLNGEAHFFVHWFAQVHRQKTTVKKKTFFLKNYVASLFTFFEKVFPICKFFTAWCLDVRFWDLLYFICLKFKHSIGIFFFAERKCVDLVVIFIKGRNFCGIFTKSQKLCIHKIRTDQTSRCLFLFFFKKNLHLKKCLSCLCLRHGAYLNVSSTCLRICRSIHSTRSVWVFLK